MSKIGNRVHPVNPKSGAQNQQHQRQQQNNGQNNQKQGNNSRNPIMEKAQPTDGFDRAKNNNLVNLSGGPAQNPLSITKDGLVTGRLGDGAAGPATIQVINSAGGRESMGVSFKAHIPEGGVANFRIPENGTSGVQINTNDGVTYEAKK